jgi:hypothetical protein
VRCCTIRSLSCITHWLFSLLKCCIGWRVPFQRGRETLQEDILGKWEPRVSCGTEFYFIFVVLMLLELMCTGSHLALYSFSGASSQGSSCSSCEENLWSKFEKLSSRIKRTLWIYYCSCGKIQKGTFWIIVSENIIFKIIFCKICLVFFLIKIFRKICC